MLAARRDSTTATEGILVKEDPVKPERNLAAAIIFQAWKEASEGDPSALSFGLDKDSNLPLWCHLCDMNVGLTRSCFRRLKNGEHETLPLIIPAAFINRDRRKHAQYVFTSDEARRAVELFIKQRRMKVTREGAYTWVALEMGKRFEVIKKLLMVIHKAIREKRRLPIMGLPDDFQEAWTNRKRPGKSRKGKENDGI